MTAGNLVGTWVKFPAPEVVEVLAAAGLDVVVIDLEHATLDLTTVARMIGVARDRGIRPFVRVPGRTARDVQPVLDAGAAGIVVPHVDDVAAAREAVQAIRFPPLGQRGASPSGRAGGWGQTSLPDYLGTGADVCVVAQIESLEGLDNIGAIAGVLGIDAVFIGEVDLAASTGMAVDVPALRARIKQAEAVCHAGGFVLADGAADGAEAALRFARGYQLVLVGTDVGHLHRSTAQAVLAARTAEPASAGPVRPGPTSMTADQLTASVELTRLVTEVWFEIDHTDGAAVAEHFTVEASLTITGSALHGRAAIDEFYRSRHARGPRVSRHLVTNLHFLEVGERSAHALSALVLYAEDGAAPRRQMSPALVADVYDDFVHQDGRWLIDDRRIVAQFLPENNTLTVPAP
ncbi:aldolase/citrate lyase family protein [Kribbella sp. NPDC058245]|uniref:aldolase/citrate lyase family protein n=1 Tax=Kribbella sp. NPDC058245 TaxID=3346399 RepID=UPI0036E4332B